MRRFRLGVIGLGGIGSAAAWWGARRLGGQVIGFDRFEAGHRRGASEDHSRIIRLSYHRPDAVELARDAYRAWAELEAASGIALVVRTGGIDLYPAGAAIDRADYLGAMDAVGVGYEVLDHAAARRRWPALRLDADTVVVHQADAGLVRASAANAAHRALAADAGAELRHGCPAEAVEPVADGYLVRAGDEQIAVERVVIAADAWTNQVTAGLGWEVDLVVTQEQVAYFDAGPALDGLPVWIWMDDPSFYGLPAVDGSGVKIGQDVGGVEVTGDDRGFDPDPAYRDRLVGFQEGLLPGSTTRLVEERTCLYTMTPDREFVVDHVPGHDTAVVGLGAAHGYKFAGVFGRAMVELALDGTTGHDLSGWSATRSALTDRSTARSFLL